MSPALVFLCTTPHSTMHNVSEVPVPLPSSASLPCPELQLWQSYRAVLDAADVSSFGLTFTLSTAWLGHSVEVPLGGK